MIRHHLLRFLQQYLGGRMRDTLPHPEQLALPSFRSLRRDFQNTRRYTCSALVILLLSPSLLLAQNSSTASLAGTVKDSSGAVVPGAVVTVRTLATENGLGPSGYERRSSWASA